MKTTKMRKKRMSTPNTFTISQRLLVTDWKYLRISVCAASTFIDVSSTFASILKPERVRCYQISPMQRDILLLSWVAKTGDGSEVTQNYPK